MGKILLCLITIFLIIGIAVLSNPFYMAYLSTKVDCIGTDSIKGSGYEKVGEYVNNTLFIYVNQTCDPVKYQEVSKHELCHEQQAQQHRVLPCPLTYFSELECYIRDELQ